MEEQDIKISLEDMRKVLEKFKGAILYPVTIENIMTVIQMQHLWSLPSQEQKI